MSKRLMRLTELVGGRTRFRLSMIKGRRLIAPAAVLIVLWVLAACAVGPDYVRPTAPAPAPDAFKETEGWKVAEPKDQMVRGKWWEVYNDPQLNALEEQVDVTNQNIALAEAQFRQASALVQAARASFFPQIGAGVTPTRALRSENVTTSVTPPGTTTIYTATLSESSWELDVWGRIRRSVEASRAGAQASAADLEGVRLSTHAAVAQNYFLLRSLDRQKQLFDATAAAYGRSLALTSNQYASGVASRGDVLQAETQLKSTQAQAINVGVQRSQTEHAIALLLGKPASVFSVPFSPLDATPPQIPFGVPSGLLERRPDIAAAERRVAAANAQIGVARAAYFPTVTLSGSAGYQSLLTSNWFTWPSRFWSLGPAMLETVYDGGLRRALNAQARAVYDQTVASYRQTVLAGFQDVEDNLAALRILEEEAEVQDQAVKTARKSVEFVLNQYKAGTANYLAVVVVQAIALANERTALTIQSSRVAASVSLIKAVGGGWNASDLPPDASISSAAKATLKK